MPSARVFSWLRVPRIWRHFKAPGAEEREWFVRVTPEPAFIQRAIDLGVPRRHICAMQGPFSQAFNVALWRDRAIDCVITKDSGAAGGYQAKAAPAQALNIPLLVIQRPQLSYPMTSNFKEVLQHAQTWHTRHEFIDPRYHRTGFLGSGKTTLLSSLIKATGQTPRLVDQ